MKQLSSINRQMVLASGSPRRLELMRMLGFDPCVRVSSVLEILAPGEIGETYTRRLSQEKAAAVAAGLSDDDPSWVLAADTVVEFDEHILEKPLDFDDACRMLRMLSDRTHRVTTSFTWLERTTGTQAVRSVTADVRFRALPDEMIHNYVKTGEPMDKAGAYGIQGVGASLVSRIDGSYHTIVGLPICEVVETLRELGGLTEFPFVGGQK